MLKILFIALKIMGENVTLILLYYLMKIEGFDFAIFSISGWGS